MKKVFIISAILLVVVLVFLGVYNFAFKKNEAAVQRPVSEPEKVAATPIKMEKIKALSSSAVLGAVFDKKTAGVKYYDANTGFVWEVSANDQGKQQITNTKVLGLKNVLWSPGLNKVLTTIQKDGQNSFFEYDYSLQKAVPLKNGIDTVVWDNLGTKILYKFFDATAKKATLNIANPDGSGWQKIADVNIRNLSIAQIPFTPLVSYWNAPNAAQETLLRAVSLTGGEPRVILTGRYGADYLWSPDGTMALVSSLASKESRNVVLGLVGMDGKYQDLGIPTLASKCVWSKDSKTIYYALPGEIPADAIMPNDYQENKFNTDDTFWKMDVTTGKKDRIIEVSEINGKYDSSQIFLSEAEGVLYFVNKTDQKLYRLIL